MGGRSKRRTASFSRFTCRRYFASMAWKKDLSLLLLRLCAGGLMVPHGWGKLNRLMDGARMPATCKFYNWMGIGTEASLGLAVFGELVAPAFIVLGLFTRWMSIPAAITMAVAAFGAHAGDPIGDKEHALLFLVPFCGAWPSWGEAVTGWTLPHRPAQISGVA